LDLAMYLKHQPSNKPVHLTRTFGAQVTGRTFDCNT
jgi:hypothetical protein